MLGMGLNDSCNQVGAVLQDTSDRDAPERIARSLSGALAIPDLLTPEHRALPPKGYGRHDVFICPNDNYSVLAAINSRAMSSESIWFAIRPVISLPATSIIIDIRN